MCVLLSSYARAGSDFVDERFGDDGVSAVETVHPRDLVLYGLFVVAIVSLIVDGQCLDDYDPVLWAPVGDHSRVIAASGIISCSPTDCE